MRIVIFLGALFFGSNDLIAQNLSENVRLTYEEFLSVVVDEHPLAKQAELLLDEAVARQLRAKGGLDPEIYFDWDEKNFDEKQYYTKYSGQITIPTSTGIELVAGYKHNDGEFLNPEAFTDPFGLWEAGIELNILQGLFVNERSTALRKAEVFNVMAENKSSIELNKLLYQASVVYFNWQRHVALGQILAEQQLLAQTYFENVKLSFEGGESTAIDTLEAHIWLQESQAAIRANSALIIESRQLLNNFIWFDNVPATLNTDVIPDSLDYTSIKQSNISDTLILESGHPLIAEIRNQQLLNELDLRLSKERLKPQLEAFYYPLFQTSDNSFNPNFNSSDNRWGFTFSYPILNRKNRADVQLNEINIERTDQNLINTNNALLNAISANVFQQRQYESELTVVDINVNGYRQLMEAEFEKFNFGESSLFLLNKRQEKYIESQSKQIQLRYKILHSRLKHLYLTNQLINR